MILAIFVTLIIFIIIFDIWIRDLYDRSLEPLVAEKWILKIAEKVYEKIHSVWHLRIESRLEEMDCSQVAQLKIGNVVYRIGSFDETNTSRKGTKYGLKVTSMSPFILPIWCMHDIYKHDFIVVFPFKVCVSECVCVREEERDCVLLCTCVCLRVYVCQPARITSIYSKISDFTNPSRKKKKKHTHKEIQNIFPAAPP